MKKLLIMFMVLISLQGLSQNSEKALILKTALLSTNIADHLNKQEAFNFQAEWFIRSKDLELDHFEFCGKELHLFKNISKGCMNIDVQLIEFTEYKFAKVVYNIYPTWKKIECSNEVPYCTNYLCLEVTAHLIKSGDNWVLLRENFKDIDFERWLFIPGVKCLLEVYVPLN